MMSNDPVMYPSKTWVLNHAAIDADSDYAARKNPGHDVDG